MEVCRAFPALRGTRGGDDCVICGGVPQPSFNYHNWLRFHVGIKSTGHARPNQEHVSEEMSDGDGNESSGNISFYCYTSHGIISPDNYLRRLCPY